jgi:multiple sugar transport system substrate-binding protein
MVRVPRSYPRPLALSVVAILLFGACTGGSAASPGGGATGTPGGAAGGSPEPTPVTGASCGQGAAEVKFWTSHTPPDSDTLKKIVDSFNQANTDICVKMTIVPGAETDVAKLLTAIRGGAAPDVYMADRFTVPQRAEEGVLEELPGDVASLKDQHLEFAWAETQFQGKTFAIPFDTDARALFYNIDLITAAGEDPAQLDISKGPPTIELVNKIADKITKSDASGNYEVLGWLPGGPHEGGTPGALDQGWHYTWGFVHGGNFADVAACKVTPTDPGVVAGYQFLYDWAKQRDPQKLSRWVSTNAPPKFPTQQNPFIIGKLGMVVTGDWRIAEMAKYAPNTKFGFTYIPVPQAGAQSATWAGGWSVALIPGSKVKDQAVRFMKYFGGEEGQKVYTKETAHLPTIKTLLTDTSLFDPQHAQFLDLLKVAKNRPPLAVGALYWDELTNAQGSVELNTKEPQAALQEVEQKVQPQLQQVGC